MKEFPSSMLSLITETSIRLPNDVLHVFQKARQREEQGTRSALALSTLNTNILQAEQTQGPLCQDTGMPTFFIHFPYGFNTKEIVPYIEESISSATQQGKLRPNSVNPLTGKNSGNNLGEGMPVIHWEPWARDYIEIRLLLKGGGCENKNIQYSLPCTLEGLGRASRDLDGVRKCILHSVYQAQGQGCSSGFLGVCIGGDRASGYECAKEQLFREMEDCNPDPQLATLENYILEKANTLGIGTMGFGGEVTLLGCKIGTRHRIPASFFVSVAYNCWAFRRQGVRINPETGEILEWLYRNTTTLSKPDNGPTSPSPLKWDLHEQGKVVHLRPPLREEEIRSLKVGDVVILSGSLHTGRDALHKYLMNHSSPHDLRGGVLYHCGPVALKDRKTNTWKIQGAGPTTSIREEPYQADIIAKLGLRAVIGKGGMGQKTLRSLQECGAIYLNAIGGAAQFYSTCIEKVVGVDFLEWGVPEAMWHLKVKDFPAIVTMDANGNSLHEEVDKSSLEKLRQLADPVFT